MKLYYAPGACSLADHIALREADLQFELEKVDLGAKRTEHGEDFTSVNRKGYVPALRLDDGELLTENIALLDWIAQQHPGLTPAGATGRTRLLGALAFISTEVHKSFKPFFSGGSDQEKAKASDLIARRLQYLADTFGGDYVLGDFTVADCYLFVMLMWSAKFGVTIPDPLPAFVERMKARDAVTTALSVEGLA